VNRYKGPAPALGAPLTLVKNGRATLLLALAEPVADAAQRLRLHTQVRG
jgi:hypothetical protein